LIFKEPQIEALLFLCVKNQKQSVFALSIVLNGLYAAISASIAPLLTDAGFPLQSRLVHVLFSLLLLSAICKLKEPFVSERLFCFIPMPAALRAL
jgi:hypothetical protein